VCETPPKAKFRYNNSCCLGKGQTSAMSWCKGGVGHNGGKHHTPKSYMGEKMLHVDTFATHQWHCLPGWNWLKPYMFRLTPCNTL
jgi:hypothetical protein